MGTHRHIYIHIYIFLCVCGDGDGWGKEAMLGTEIWKSSYSHSWFLQDPPGVVSCRGWNFQSQEIGFPELFLSSSCHGDQPQSFHSFWYQEHFSSAGEMEGAQPQHASGGAGGEGSSKKQCGGLASLKEAEEPGGRTRAKVCTVLVLLSANMADLRSPLLFSFSSSLGLLTSTNTRR